ncbi:hypothetical protein ANO11243_013330 [Dothideomycetidae sp. 11243]|nr:hypothetical protein ANO11243_013330 [fungal sp. No.11243]
MVEGPVVWEWLHSTSVCHGDTSYQQTGTAILVRLTGQGSQAAPNGPSDGRAGGQSGGNMRAAGSDPMCGGEARYVQCAACIAGKRKGNETNGKAKGAEA